ncbi:hypothetical protein BVF91_05575 [Thermoanaerobacterium sp. PSU-2]|jgi:hypothetical protein|uniref:hypothetical protein n=1 Tax=Thermoanaerobacterium sp. PSU-2 TaxID=1930849 RepID=UPI000A1472E9|nr:hypothetical protein [Thermoanaerobacterium sp. PSU-2]ORX23651.1 hypothetical protein BVF91_05575 [Thermoanaerobacterium sp. PSU-2]
MLKKAVSLVLVVVLLSVSTFSSVFAESTKSAFKDDPVITFFSPEFSNAYIEQDFLDLRDTSMKVVNGKIVADSNNNRQLADKLNKIFKDAPNVSSDIKKHLDSSSLKLIGIAKATVYVEEKYEKKNNKLVCISSKLLSADEINRIGKNKFIPIEDEKANVQSLDASGIQPYDTESRGTLSLYFTLYKDSNSSHSIEYVLTGNANWSGFNFLYSAENNPAVGEDFIGYAWGGGFSYYLENISGIWSNGANATFYKADSVPNAGHVWSFNEYLSINGYKYYVKQINTGIRLYKNTLTGGGNDTSAVFKYIHTYQDVSGSISISANVAGVGAGFSLSNVAKQWSIVTQIGGLNY